MYQRNHTHTDTHTHTYSQVTNIWLFHPCKRTQLVQCEALDVGDPYKAMSLSQTHTQAFFSSFIQPQYSALFQHWGPYLYLYLYTHTYLSYSILHRVYYTLSWSVALLWRRVWLFHSALGLVYCLISQIYLDWIKYRYIISCLGFVSVISPLSINVSSVKHWLDSLLYHHMLLL